MATESKTIKAQPYFNQENKVYSLVQDSTTFTIIGKKTKESTATEVLVEDVFADLKKKTGGQWKSNTKGDYFYYDVQVSNIDGDGETTVQIETPTPVIEDFCNSDGEPELDIDSSTDSLWSIYWKTKFKESMDSYQKQAVVSPTQTVHHETQIVNPETQKLETIPEKKIDRPMDQTIETLISTLY